MLRSAATAVLCLWIHVAVGGCSSETADSGPATPERTVAALSDSVISRPVVVLETPSGQIDLELLPEVAPHHVAQFLSLVREGFYDGTTFHRIVPGFVVQGGDPNTKDEDPDNDGYGGLEDRRLEPEFSGRPFQRGSLGMARDFRPDGASCQFFICVARSAHLDGTHTLFGRVTAGMDVVDDIASARTDDEGRPETEEAVIRAWVREP